MMRAASPSPWLALLAMALLARRPGRRRCGDALPAPRTITVADLLADPEAYTGQRGGARRTGRGLRRAERRDGVDPAERRPVRRRPPCSPAAGLAGANLGIGVRFPAELWPGFDSPGGYRVRGPVVELTGIWRYHDPERGGESYLDVTGWCSSPSRWPWRRGCAGCPWGWAWASWGRWRGPHSGGPAPARRLRTVLPAATAALLLLRRLRAKYSSWAPAGQERRRRGLP